MLFNSCFEYFVNFNWLLWNFLGYLKEIHQLKIEGGVESFRVHSQNGVKVL